MRPASRVSKMKCFITGSEDHCLFRRLVWCNSVRLSPSSGGMPRTPLPLRQKRKRRHCRGQANAQRSSPMPGSAGRVCTTLQRVVRARAACCSNGWGGYCSARRLRNGWPTPLASTRYTAAPTLPAPADMIRTLRDHRALEPRDQGASARRLIIAVGSPSLIGGVATT